MDKTYTIDNIDTLMEAKWSLFQEEIMTKAEAEKKYGIRIVGWYEYVQESFWFATQFYL